MQGWQYRDFCGDLCFRNARTLAPVDVLQCQHVSVCVRTLPSNVYLGRRRRDWEKGGLLRHAAAWK